MKNFKYFILLALFPIFVFSVLVAAKIVFAPQNFSTNFKTIKIRNTVIIAEIADTPEKQTKGLAGRTSLPQNQGMLFVFDQPDYYPFWMKGMLFNLDLIWIRDNKVLEVTRNVALGDYQPPETLAPKEKVDKVLEVNAGITERLGVKEGDMIK